MYKKRFSVLTAFVATFAMLLSGLSLADTLEGDSLQAIAEKATALDFGTVCVGDTTTGTVHLAMKRSGNAGNANTLANGTTVTIAAHSASTGLTAGAPSATITLPANWTTLPNDTLSDKVTATVTLDTSVARSISGEVRYEASGTNTSNALRTFVDPIPVKAVVQNCAPAVVAPTVGYTLDPATADGANGWYKSAVNLTWNITGTSPTLTDCVNQTITADQAKTTYSCTATNSAGSDWKSVEIGLDSTAPSITDNGATAGTVGHNGWYTSAVTNRFTAADATSGLPAGFVNPFTQSSGPNEGSAVEIDSGLVTDVAGNTNTGISSAAFKIDLTDPTNIQFMGGPADGSTHYFGSVPPAPTCTADDAISGIASCSVMGHGTAVGTHTLTATATDNAGRSAIAEQTYSVLAWTADGFKSPVTSDLTKVNRAKAGSTVPLKFQVFAGNTELTSTATIGATFHYAQKTCDGSDDPVDVPMGDAGSTSIRYENGEFVRNWKAPTAKGCGLLTVTLADGSRVRADFRIV